MHRPPRPRLHISIITSDIRAILDFGEAHRSLKTRIQLSSGEACHIPVCTDRKLHLHTDMTMDQDLPTPRRLIEARSGSVKGR
jgi:hypothetical protein